MPIRPATAADLTRMSELAAQKREQYREYAPVFHRPSAGAREAYEPHLAALVEADVELTVVHESDGRVDGFLVASLVPPPPVYDPGGLTCMVDDFVVATPDLWDSAGRALLEHAIAVTRARGAVQTVVVCGPKDLPKRELLLSMGHDVASEWFTLPFGSG